MHDDTPAASPEDAEHRLLADINRDRTAAGLPFLRWDDALAAVARAYSEEMRRTHVVAHISPTSGSAADRVRAAGIRTAIVLENVLWSQCRDRGRWRGLAECCDEAAD